MAERFDWNEGAVATLRAAAAEGESASAIAARLGDGVTRNVVIGKAHRLGVKLGMRQATARADAAPATNPTGPVPSPQRPLTSPLAAVPVSAANALEPVRLTILELRYRTCRYPVGNISRPELAGYCGAMTVEGKPYCAACCGLAYQPMAERRRHDRLISRGARP